MSPETLSSWSVSAGIIFSELTCTDPSGSSSAGMRSSSSESSISGQAAGWHCTSHVLGILRIHSCQFSIKSDSVPFIKGRMYLMYVCNCATLCRLNGVPFCCAYLVSIRVCSQIANEHVRDGIPRSYNLLFSNKHILRVKQILATRNAISYKFVCNL